MAEAISRRMAYMRTRQSPDLSAVLRAFTASPSKFRIVRSINPPSTSSAATPLKTLYILDSSFNPPSKAHLSLAVTALTRASSKGVENPHRLLLLFSTHNADKAPSPASFEDRLAMMSLFAEDLSEHLSRTANLSERIPIDIGLTKAPYYADKSIAIEEAAEETPYPKKLTHIHLIGYDTVTRFLAPKYYPKHDPPLSALSPYFDAGHRLLVTLRPSNAEDTSSKEFGSVKDQAAYITGLQTGSLEKEGFQAKWASQIEVVTGKEGVGVSSTRVRKAAKEHKWEELERLCTPSVVQWVIGQALYEDARAARTA